MREMKCASQCLWIERIQRCEKLFDRLACWIRFRCSFLTAVDFAGTEPRLNRPPPALASHNVRDLLSGNLLAVLSISGVLSGYVHFVCRNLQDPPILPLASVPSKGKYILEDVSVAFGILVRRRIYRKLTGRRPDVWEVQGSRPDSDVARVPSVLEIVESCETEQSQPTLSRLLDCFDEALVAERVSFARRRRTATDEEGSKNRRDEKED